MDKSTTVSRRAGVLPEPMANLPAVLLRALPLPTSHGGQTSRLSVQNGGTARNGLEEIGLMSIKDGMLITMANGTIGNITHGI
jgi:hypothetical protein